MKKNILALMAVPFVIVAAPKELVDVQVYPKDANISTKRGKQSLVVQAKYSDSTTRDVTAEAKYTFADPKFAKLEKNTLLPLADGWAPTEDLYWLGDDQIGLVAARRGAEGPDLGFLRITPDGAQEVALPLMDESHCRRPDGSFLFRGFLLGNCPGGDLLLTPVGGLPLAVRLLPCGPCYADYDQQKNGSPASNADSQQSPLSLLSLPGGRDYF